MNVFRLNEMERTWSELCEGSDLSEKHHFREKTIDVDPIVYYNVCASSNIVSKYTLLDAPDNMKDKLLSFVERGVKPSRGSYTIVIDGKEIPLNLDSVYLLSEDDWMQFLKDPECLMKIHSLMSMFGADVKQLTSLIFFYMYSRSFCAKSSSITVHNGTAEQIITPVVAELTKTYGDDAYKCSYEALLLHGFTYRFMLSTLPASVIYSHSLTVVCNHNIPEFYEILHKVYKFYFQYFLVYDSDIDDAQTNAEYLNVCKELAFGDHVRKMREGDSYYIPSLFDQSRGSSAVYFMNNYLKYRRSKTNDIELFKSMGGIPAFKNHDELQEVVEDYHKKRFDAVFLSMEGHYILSEKGDNRKVELDQLMKSDEHRGKTISLLQTVRNGINVFKKERLLEMQIEKGAPRNEFSRAVAPSSPPRDVHTDRLMIKTNPFE